VVQARSAPEPCGRRSRASGQPWLDRCRHPSTRRLHCLRGAPADDEFDRAAPRTRRSPCAARPSRLRSCNGLSTRRAKLRSIPNRKPFDSFLKIGFVLPTHATEDWALNWTVRDLAAATGLHRNTITNIEVGRYAGDETSLAVIERVLTKAGVEFLDENGGGPGVRLRKTQQRGNRK
jgi:hypothetical protein